MAKKILGWLGIIVGGYFLIQIISMVIYLAYNICLSGFDFTPVGYRFELLKDTPVCELAKAVKNEDTAKIRELIQEKHLDVNYQERKSNVATTLLHLAVGNDKVLSVKALLENGARQNTRDSGGKYPIHDILEMLFPHPHRAEILELLLKHGADPNSRLIRNIPPASYVNEINEKGINTPGIFHRHIVPGVIDSVRVPLMDAIQDLECTKLLLKYGADLYYQVKDNDSSFAYYNWEEMFVFRPKSKTEPDENIFVAKYLIIEKQFAVPNPFYQNSKLTAIDLLKKAYFSDPAKQKAKEEILAYLQKEGFPEHGSIPNKK